MVFVAAAILMYRLQYKTYGKKTFILEYALTARTRAGFLVKFELHISKDLVYNLKIADHFSV